MTDDKLVSESLKKVVLAAVEKEGQRIREDRSNQYLILGRVFRCQSIIEEQLRLYIRSKNPTLDLDSHPFNGLDALLKVANRMFGSAIVGNLYQALNSFREIRNKLGHEPSADLNTLGQIQGIHNFLKGATEYSQASNIVTIERFTLVLTAIVAAIVEVDQKLTDLEREQAVLKRVGELMEWDKT